MLTVEIKINDTELYRAEAYLQGGDLEGLCIYKIVINDVDAGVVTHDRTDLAWVLAGLILARFPTPDKTLQEEGGAHTGPAPWVGVERDVKRVLELTRAGDWAMTQEAAASAKLALEGEQ